MPTEIEGMKSRASHALTWRIWEIGLPRSGEMAQVSVRADLLDAIQKFVQLDGADCYVWLCVVSLLCTAVEALADFRV